MYVKEDKIANFHKLVKDGEISKVEEFLNKLSRGSRRKLLNDNLNSNSLTENEDLQSNSLTAIDVAVDSKNLEMVKYLSSKAKVTEDTKSEALQKAQKDFDYQGYKDKKQKLEGKNQELEDANKELAKSIQSLEAKQTELETKKREFEIAKTEFYDTQVYKKANRQYELKKAEALDTTIIDTDEGVTAAKKKYDNSKTKHEATTKKLDTVREFSKRAEVANSQQDIDNLLDSIIADGDLEPNYKDKFQKIQENITKAQARVLGQVLSHDDFTNFKNSIETDLALLADNYIDKEKIENKELADNQSTYEKAREDTKKRKIQEKKESAETTFNETVKGTEKYKKYKKAETEVEALKAQIEYLDDKQQILESQSKNLITDLNSQSKNLVKQQKTYEIIKTLVDNGADDSIITDQDLKKDLTAEKATQKEDRNKEYLNARYKRKTERKSTTESKNQTLQNKYDKAVTEYNTKKAESKDEEQEQKNTTSNFAKTGFFYVMFAVAALLLIATLAGVTAGLFGGSWSSVFSTYIAPTASTIGMLGMIGACGVALVAAGKVGLDKLNSNKLDEPQKEEYKFLNKVLDAVGLDLEQLGVNEDIIRRQIKRGKDLSHIIENINIGSKANQESKSTDTSSQESISTLKEKLRSLLERKEGASVADVRKAAKNAGVSLKNTTRNDPARKQEFAARGRQI
jgi:hypothetical protein